MATKSVGQCTDVIVQKAEIVGDIFFTSNRGGQYQDLSPSRAGDFARSLQIEIWFHYDNPHILVQHRLDEIVRVAVVWRNSHKRLDLSQGHQSETVHEIRPRAMVSDHFLAPVGLHLCFPNLFAFTEA